MGCSKQKEKNEYEIRLDQAIQS